MDKKRILAVDSDRATQKWLAGLLIKAGYEVLLAGTGSDGMAKAVMEKPDLVILDLHLPDMPGEQVFTRIHQDPQTAHIPIIALSINDNSQEITRLLEGGISDYIIKRPGIEMELLGKCAAFVSRGRITGRLQPTGKLITFFSAKGGVGTSTLCLNMAHSFAQQVAPKTVLAADLALPLGSLSLMMAAKSGCTIAELTSSPGPYDIQGLKDELMTHPVWKIAILQGSRSPAEAQTLNPGHIIHIFDSLRSAFDYVLVDVSRALSRLSMPLLEHADGIVLVLGPDPVTVELTQAAMEYLEETGIPRNNLFLVLNRAVGREGLTKPEIEKRFKYPIGGSVPYSPENLTLATNQGVPFAVRFPEDIIARVFNDLTSLLRKQIKDA